MKTSDKILLGFSVGALGLFGALHLVLYAEYKNGNILDTKELHDEQFNRFRLPQPNYLFLRGTIWVNIFPSDSCYIEFPKKAIDPGEGIFVQKMATNRPSLPHYQQKGDTLVIDGNNDRPIHRGFADPGYRSSVPVVNVYCRHLREIRVLNGQVMLKGATGAATPVAGRLEVENSTLWIGEAILDRNMLLMTGRHPGDPAQPREEFDSLHVESWNSIVMLNGSADVRSLHIQLEKGSELNDQQGSAEKLTVGYSRDSRVNLTGDNLKKVQLSIH